MSEFVEATVGAEECPDREGQETYTKEEVDGLLQAEADKRVAQALETAKAKWQKQYTAELERIRVETERMAAMTAEEKAEHLSRQREDEIAVREAELRRRELRAEACEILANKGLPIELVDVINLDGTDGCYAGIDALEMALRTAVEEAVAQRLVGCAPRGGSGAIKITGEEFAKMGYKERAEIFHSAPELYRELTGASLKTKGI